MKDALSLSLQASLTAQWIGLVINGLALNQTLAPKDQILTTSLWIETIVQVIELAFYTWYAVHFRTVSEATFFRYHDWAVTTPLMLVSTIFYFEYQNSPETTVTVESIWAEHSTTILLIGAFNLIMLLFGYLYERGVIGLWESQVVGFAAYGGTFYLLWDAFASKTTGNLPVYAFMTTVWGLYGVAAFASPGLKNTAYNLLDVVAKNFYGVFLSYLIATKAIPNRV
jgi:hypothetical protein